MLCNLFKKGNLGIMRMGTGMGVGDELMNVGWFVRDTAEIVGCGLSRELGRNSMVDSNQTSLVGIIGGLRVLGGMRLKGIEYLFGNMASSEERLGEV